MVLGEVAHPGLVAPAHVAGVGRQPVDGDLQQRRLAESIRANDRHPLAPAHDQRHVAEHTLGPVGLGQPGHLQHLPAARAGGLEAQHRRAARAGHQLLHLDALDLLEPALGLGGLGVLRPEALHEGPLAGDLLQGPLVAGLLLLADGRLVPLERRVAAGVERDGPVVDVQGVGGDVVQEALVVGDHHRAAGVGVQELLQPADGQDVQVVGRLVQQQQIGPAHQHLGQQHAQLEPARQRAQRLAVRRHRDAQALQHRAGPGLQRVTIVGSDAVLEIGDPDRIGMGFGRQPALLGQRPGDHLVPAHRQVQDDLGVVQEAVLAQHPHPRALGQQHLAGAGLLVTGQDAQERRLARAVGAHQPVTAAGVQLKRHPLEQGAGPVGLGDARGGKQGRVSLAGASLLRAVEAGLDLPGLAQPLQQLGFAA